MTKSYRVLLVSAGMAIAAAMAAGNVAQLPSPDFWGDMLKKSVEANASNPDRRGRTQIPAKASEGAEVIWDQDFSLLTDGSETELGTDLTPNYFDQGDPYVSAEYMGEEGWWGMGIYSAGGKAALAYPSYGGVINTPNKNMYGRVIVTMKVKVCEGAKEGKEYNFLINCLKGTPYVPVSVNDLPPNTPGAANTLFSQRVEDGWQEVSAVIYNPYQGDNCWIQINAVNFSKYGILIDDLKVTRDYDFCMNPTDLSCTDFTDNGFTASWKPGAENKSYLFSLMEMRYTGEGGEFKETFDAIGVNSEGVVDAATLPTTVDIHGKDNVIKGSANGGFEDSPAIILSNQEDYVSTPISKGRITSISFYAQSNTAESYGVLLVSAYDGKKWNLIGYIDFVRLSAGGTWKLAEPDVYAYRFSIRDALPGEELLFDNLQWTTESPMEQSMVMEDHPLDSTSITLDTLNPDGYYYFSVKGVNGDIVSPGTDYTLALGAPAPEALEATDVDKEGAFTARWNPSVKAQSYLVKNYETRTVKTDQTAYKVLVDNFANAKTEEEGNANVLPGHSFDGIADVDGWTVDAGLYMNGAIGANNGGMLISPELTLDNGNGRFTIVFSASIPEGYTLVVQYGDKYECLTFDGTPDEYGLVTGDFSVTFDNGTTHDCIVFYSLQESYFFINSIQVLQDVKVGDRIYTLCGSYNVDGHDSDSLRISGLANTPDYDYSYNVTACGTYNGRKFQSLPSADILVNLNTNGIDSQEELLTPTVITRDGNTVIVILPAETQVRVFDTSGNLVRRIKGSVGVNRIEMAYAGVYIVTANGKVMKIVIP